MKQITSVIMALLLGSSALLPAFSHAAPVTSPDLGREALSRKRLESKWGIELTSVRLSANGNMVDFRYRVVDSDKAGELGNREAKAFLMDHATGAKLLVAKTPKIGPLRQTSQNPESGRIYFMLFSNPGKLVKTGSRVSVVVGGFRADNITVE